MIDEIRPKRKFQNNYCQMLLFIIAFCFTSYTAKILFHQSPIELGTVTGIVTVDCRQSDDIAIGSSVTGLPAVINSHYTVTVQSQCSDCAYYSR